MEKGYSRCSCAFNILFNYCIHSHGECSKAIESLPLLLVFGGRLLRGGLSMTELYTKFIVQGSILSKISGNPDGLLR